MIPKNVRLYWIPINAARAMRIPIHHTTYQHPIRITWIFSCCIRLNLGTWYILVESLRVTQFASILLNNPWCSLRIGLSPSLCLYTNVRRCRYRLNTMWSPNTRIYLHTGSPKLNCSKLLYLGRVSTLQVFGVWICFVEDSATNNMYKGIERKMEDRRYYTNIRVVGK